MSNANKSQKGSPSTATLTHVLAAVVRKYAVNGVVRMTKAEMSFENEGVMALDSDVDETTGDVVLRVSHAKE